MSSTSESDFPNGWSQRAFINLRADKLWDVVNQSIDSLVADYRSTLVIAHPTALTSVQVADKVAEYRERAIRRNDLACKYIANSISEEQMSHLIHLTSAYEMWDTLRGLHSHGRPSRTMDLLNTLAQPYAGDIPFKEFVNKVKIAMTDFQNLGAPLPHWLFAGMLVRSLPAQYDSIVGNLASDIDIHMDWNTFYPKLLMNVEMADSRNKQKESLSARIVDDTSLVARISTTAQKDYSKSYCSRCKALGHERGWRLCPSRNKDASAPVSSDSNSNVAAIGVDESALMTYTFPYSRTMPRFPWIIDSGAKVHCVGDKSVLSDVISEPLKISVADQSQIDSPGHGSVTFLTSYGSRITIKRVYYMPGAQCGFISIDRLLESMTYAVGPQNNLIFSIRGKSIIRSRPGRGFVMDAAPVQPIMSSSSPSMVGANRLTGTCTLMEAHRKLGHQSPAAIVLAVKSGAITGITLKDEKVTSCFSCIQAKSKRSPFSAKSTEAPHALYRVFIDLGFVEHPNHHGDTIYLAIVDQYSTAKWTMVLKDKRAESIVDAWSKFQVEAERQTGQKIKRVRSDNGREFDNSMFRDLLVKQGIIVEFTAPYTPEQNGQVERLNGSLMGLVRSMLLDSGLPMRFWSDALAVATFVLNRRPHPRIQGKTAIEVLLGKKPNLAHLQPFGSTAFVHVPKERRTKLAPRSIQGVFIGYSGEYNYRVWVQSSNQVYVSRHVTFIGTPSVVTSSQDRADASGPVHHPQPHPPDVLPSTPASPVVGLTFPDPQPPPVVPIGVGQQGGDLAVVPRKDDDNDDNDGPDDGPDDYHDAEEPLDGEAEVALAPREGYAIVRTGPNPGQFENVNSSNILPAGSRRRPQPPEVILPIIAAIMVDALDTPPMFLDKLSYDAYCAAVFAEEDIEIPKTFEEAMKSPYRNHWSAAMVSELLQFDHHGVFQEVKWHEGIRVLGTIWVYSIKRDASGKIIRFKARLVAQGFAQRPDIDYHDTYAPVARSSTILFLIALAAAQGLHLEQFDFDCAFLNGKMTEDVYVRYPKGWNGPQSPGKCLKLVGSMYGTKQAPREWYRAVNDLMVSRGYMRATADACLYIKHSGTSFAIITLYVDDGLIASNNQSFLDSELASLHKAFKLKRLGPVSYFLGFEIHRTKDHILVHQSKYVRTMLEKFDFASLSKRRAVTPMDDRPSLRIDTTPFADVSLYQSAVGSLQYASTRCRPDIAIAVRAVAQKNSCPTVDDWAAVKRIFRYLNSTIDLGILYRNSSTTRLMVYSDASFADDPESRRSVGAYASMLAGSVISWQSKQQSMIATSTTEAEILSASSATREAIWLRRLAGDVGIPQAHPTIIQEDNAACIQIAKDPVDHMRTKHFDIAHLFVRERVASGEVELEYCPTHVNAADITTKPLGFQRFDQLRALLGMVSLVSLTGGSVRGGV
ncbi:BZ3500_MvSof-1268-A1-R1_Chr4-1g06749 [Microbotryum saponariae]|uniref:BZ3500_MvSof-1268-A1-R1_Chr4-1g06749 protein n=3 Tax=Microbotryum TaxID=34416 RepID=A0A2X0LH80_9BASI|nr:BZ3500_MvSof-1268-A1-R1_Chr4-1g06749 [Microbotryum saponariae]SDA06414.1 BZ3501_MvSof-1269-A2-R1_Chr4-1g06459 [Microbotryum saponariae]